MFFLGQQRSSLGEGMGDVDVVQSDVPDTCWMGGFNKTLFFYGISEKTFTNDKYFCRIFSTRTSGMWLENIFKKIYLVASKNQWI